LQSARIYATIIIDALDECEDDHPASAVLSLMARYIDEIRFVKFLITGRPELPIRSGFRLRSLRPHTEVFLLHEVDRLTVDQDIELYLRTCLSEIVVERSHFDLTVPWPSEREIIAATRKCSGLFIVASVIVKFVGSRHHKPQERLKIIISRPHSTVHEGKSGIDQMYDQVLVHSFDDVSEDDTSFYARLQLVVGSVVSVFNPLSCASLATMLGIQPNDVWTALRSLHSIFIIPDSESEPIRICHKSLADYFTDATRCTDARFHINPSVVHLELGIRCLRLMNMKLKKNICGLPRYAMNADVHNLGGLREKCIGGALEYACRSWEKHLRLGLGDGGDARHLIQLLKDFFYHHLLQWLEVLSIVGDLRCAVYSLHGVTSWLVDVGAFLFSFISLFMSVKIQDVTSDANFLDLVKDSEKFVLRFFDGIECSAAHIYESALPLSPSSSSVRAVYLDQMSTDVRFSSIDHSWDACTRTIQVEDSARSITFSHNDDLIAVGEREVVEIFEAATGQRRGTLMADNSVWCLAFSPDDSILVTGCEAGRVDVWDLQTGGLIGILEGHANWVVSVAFSPCGTMIATSSYDCTIPIWDASSLECCCILEGHSDRVPAVCWSYTGREVISGSWDTTIKVWNVSDRSCAHTFTIHSEAVSSVASSPDSSLVVSGFEDGTIRVFDTKIDAGGVLHTISTNAEAITSVKFLPRGQIMYTTSDFLLVMRDLNENADFLTFEYEESDGVAISSDGSRLASCDSDVLKIWQTNSSNKNQTVAGHHTAAVYRVSFSEDGQLVASGSEDFTVKIWDASTGRCITTLQGHPDGVDRVLFSPDSTLCASSGFNDSIRIWDVRTGSPVSTLGENGPLFGMCFSPSGSQLLTVTWTNGHLVVKLWEVATGDCLALMEINSEYTRNVPASFGLDGTSITLTVNAKIQRWGLHSESSTDEDTKNPSSLPMVFVPMPNTEWSISPDRPSQHQYRHDENSPWVLDKQNRRMLWVPPDLRLRSDFCGTKVVFGSTLSTGGRLGVTIVDFSDIEHEPE
jgi:WD40 repeat protein